MSSDRVLNIAARAEQASKEIPQPEPSVPTEDSMALEFVHRHGKDYRYVPRGIAGYGGTASDGPMIRRATSSR